MSAVRPRVLARAVAGVALGAVIIPATASAAAAPKLGSRTLRPGMRGADVVALQRDLTQTGFKVRVTGTFDRPTARSVAAFERRYHLATDPAVTPSFVRDLLKIRYFDVNAISSDSNGGGGLGSGSSGGTGSSGSGSTGSSGSGSSGGSSGSGTSGTSGGPVDGEGSGTTKMPKLRGPRHAYGSRTMRRGMRGTDVEMLQEYLTLAGFPTSVDGDFGPLTRASVVSFEQTDHFRDNGVVARAEALSLRRDVNTADTAVGTAEQATLNANGTVTPPAGAPQAVVNAIAAANSIIDTPYIYGGGHGSFNDTGYDCSGAVSYALHGGGLLSTPEDSDGLETYGRPGPGKWITVYSDPGHAFVVIAGLAFDTAHYGPTFPSGSGPRWLAPNDVTANLQDGGDYVERHPAGL